uniref:Uncharacterized protein n=1 Tax=Romanomermis culicivorax TaxID=13658 RepID=A0A915KF16_ROMCU
MSLKSCLKKSPTSVKIFIKNVTKRMLKETKDREKENVSKNEGIKNKKKYVEKH